MNADENPFGGALLWTFVLNCWVLTREPGAAVDWQARTPPWVCFGSFLVYPLCSGSQRFFVHRASPAGVCFANASVLTAFRTNGVVTEVPQFPIINFHGTMWQACGSMRQHARHLQQNVCTQSKLWQHVWDLWHFCKQMIVLTLSGSRRASHRMELMVFSEIRG